MSVIHVAIAFSSFGSALIAYFFVKNFLINIVWRAHSERLNRSFRFLFISWPAGKAATVHMVIVVTVFSVSIVTVEISLGVLCPVFWLLPEYVLQRWEIKKRVRISEQLASWLIVLANSLKSTPNIMDALASSVALIRSPLREEVDLLVQEVSLGEHLNHAMQRSVERLCSPLYSSVMTTLLIARKSGGDLPKILEVSSSQLREMERLSGVIRSRTAEGKSQTFVLAILPFVMVASLQKVDESLIQGLWDSGSGQMILAASLLCWIGSVLLARRIVRVEL